MKIDVNASLSGAGGGTAEINLLEGVVNGEVRAQCDLLYLKR